MIWRRQRRTRLLLHQKRAAIDPPAKLIITLLWKMLNILKGHMAYLMGHTHLNEEICQIISADLTKNGSQKWRNCSLVACQPRSTLQSGYRFKAHALKSVSLGREFRSQRNIFFCFLTKKKSRRPREVRTYCHRSKKALHTVRVPLQLDNGVTCEGGA